MSGARPTLSHHNGERVAVEVRVGRTARAALAPETPRFYLSARLAHLRDSATPRR